MSINWDLKKIFIIFKSPKRKKSVIEVLSFSGQSHLVYSTDQICRHWNIYKNKNREKTTDWENQFQHMNNCLQTWKRKGMCNYAKCRFSIPIFLGLGRFRFFMMFTNSSLLLVRRGLNLRSSPTVDTVWPEAYRNRTQKVICGVKTLPENNIIWQTHLQNLNKLLKMHWKYWIICWKFQKHAMSTSIQDWHHSIIVVIVNKHVCMCFHST